MLVDCSPAHPSLFEADQVKPKRNSPVLRPLAALMLDWQLIPDGVNGCVVYSGSEDNRPWTQILGKDVSVPPNLRDCQWRILPPRHSVNAKKLEKFLKTSKWDDGKNLPLPEVPSHGADLDDVAQEFVNLHNMGPAKLKDVTTLIVMLVSKRDELNGHLGEEQRVRGREVRYGNAVMLQHVTSEKFMTVTKSRAIEGSAKRLSLHIEGTNYSNFIIRPAFKTYNDGSPISSGDLVTFVTYKPISDSKYSLRVSDLQRFREDSSEIQRALMIQHPYIESGQEVNATATAGNAQHFRALLFTSYDCQEGHEKNDALKAENIVTFYHKQKGGYLHFDPDVSARPFLYASSRVSNTERKKCHWMWKIENCRVMHAGKNVTANERNKEPFRLKHIFTNMYLQQKSNGDLTMTKLYNDKSTHFYFRNFDKNADPELVKMCDMVFIRSGDGKYLTWYSDDADYEDIHEDADKLRMSFIKMRAVEMTPDSDGLMVMGVRPPALKAAVQVRRQVLVMLDYKWQLSRLPDVGADGKLSDANLEDEDRPFGQAGVLAVTSECFQLLHMALRKLVVNLSWAETPDPMARDGIPNKNLQKILRELKVIQLAVDLLQLPFDKGAKIEGIVSNPDYKQLQTILNLLYRLLKMVVKQNLTASRSLMKHIPVFRSQLGRGILITPTIKEIFENKRELLNQITPDLVNHYADLLQTEKAPQYVDFLMNICIITSPSDGGKPEPLSKIQLMVLESLFKINPHLLPCCQMEVKAGGGLNFIINIQGTVTEQGEPLWLNLADFKKDVQVRGRTQDYAGWILNAPLGDLNAEQKALRYFIRCSNLYGRLALGRNQEALRQILFNKDLALSYDSILEVLQENALPHLIRARYWTLMERLFIDRDPQVPTPPINLTRVWRNCIAEPSDLNLNPEIEGPSIPVCKDNFHHLLAFLIVELPNLADCRHNGKPSLNGDAQFGQLELIQAMLSAASSLVDYGFFEQATSSWLPSMEKGSFSSQLRSAKELHRTPACHADDVNRKMIALMQALFAIIEPRSKFDPKDPTTARNIAALLQKRKEDKSLEACLKNSVRKDALNLILRLFNARLNTRISLCVEIWEEVFDSLDKKGWLERLTNEQLSSLLNTEKSVTSKIGDIDGSLDFEFLESLFGEHNKEIEAVIKQKCFGVNIVSPIEIGSDIYQPGLHDDNTVEIMLELSTFDDKELTTRALSLLVRNMSQRSALAERLKEVQLLVFPGTNSEKYPQ